MISHILVPLDGTPQAEAALAPADKLARATGADVTLVRAPHQAEHPQRQGDYRGEAERSGCASYLRVCAARFSPEVQVHTSVLDGAEAVERLLQAAYTFRSDLILMTSHGRSGMGRLLHGSVAEQVGRRAPFATMFVGCHSSAHS